MPRRADGGPRNPISWSHEADHGFRVTLVGPGAAGVTFTPDEHRVRIGLLLPNRRRPTDITIQPGLAESAIVDAAIWAGANPEPVRRELCTALSHWAGSIDAWVPTPPADGRPDLLAAIVGIAFPLIGRSAPQCAGTTREVPRWAAPIVACASARDAAALLVGDPPARPLVAALAESLAPPPSAPDDAPVALAPLALARMSAGVLDQDRLALILRRTEPYRPPAAWPTVEDVALAAKCFERLGPDRTSRLIADATDAPGGLGDLLITLRCYEEAHRHMGPRVPTRLAALRAAALETLPADPFTGACTAAVDEARRRAADAEVASRQVAAVFGAAEPVHEPITEPVGGRDVAGTRPVARRGTTTMVRRRPDRRHDEASADDARRYRALAPPGVPCLDPPATPNGAPNAGPSPATPIPYGRSLLDIDGLEVGLVRLVLPRTSAELTRWGQLLSNCLGTYGPAALAGTSVLIGLQRHDRLEYCLELTDRGRVRQFHGRRNTAVPLDVEHQVLDALRARSILVAH